MKKARIFKTGKNAMQSGLARRNMWVLEFEPFEAQRADPLMGWIGSGDMPRQIRLTFGSREDAVDYARREGLAYGIIAAHGSSRKAKNYAENFSPRFRFK